MIIDNHKKFRHRLSIDYQYQSINWYRLSLIVIDCHRLSISSIVHVLFTSIYLHVTPSMFGYIPNKIGVSMARQDLRFQYAYSKQGKRHCSFRPEEKVMNRHCWRPFLYSSVSTGYVYPRPRNMCIPGPVHISLGVSRVGNCVGIQ